MPRKLGLIVALAFLAAIIVGFLHIGALFSNGRRLSLDELSEFTGLVFPEGSRLIGGVSFVPWPTVGKVTMPRDQLPGFLAGAARRGLEVMQTSEYADGIVARMESNAPDAPEWWDLRGKSFIWVGIKPRAPELQTPSRYRFTDVAVTAAGEDRVVVYIHSST